MTPKKQEYPPYNPIITLTDEQKQKFSSTFYSIVQAVYGESTNQSPSQLLDSFNSRQFIKQAAVIALAFMSIGIYVRPELVPGVKQKVLRKSVNSGDEFSEFTDDLVDKPESTSNLLPKSQSDYIAKNPEIIKKAKEYLNYLYFDYFHVTVTPIKKDMYENIGKVICSICQREPENPDAKILTLKLIKEVKCFKNMKYYPAIIAVKLFTNMFRIRWILGLDASPDPESRWFKVNLWMSIAYIQNNTQLPQELRNTQPLIRKLSGTCAAKPVNEKPKIPQRNKRTAQKELNVTKKNQNNEQKNTRKTSQPTRKVPEAVQNVENAAKVTTKISTEEKDQQFYFIKSKNVCMQSTAVQVGGQFDGVSQNADEYSVSCINTTFYNNLQKEITTSLINLDQKQPKEKEREQEKEKDLSLAAKDKQPVIKNSIPSIKQDKQYEYIPLIDTYKDLGILSNSHMQLLNNNFATNTQPLLIANNQMRSTALPLDCARKKQQQSDNAESQNSTTPSQFNSTEESCNIHVEEKLYYSTLNQDKKLLERIADDNKYQYEKHTISMLEDQQEQLFWQHLAQLLIQENKLETFANKIQLSSLRLSDVATIYQSLSSDLQITLCEQLRTQLQLSTDIYCRFYNSLQFYGKVVFIPKQVLNKIREILSSCFYLSDWRSRTLEEINRFIQAKDFVSHQEPLQKNSNLIRGVRNKVLDEKSDHINISEDALIIIIETEYKKMLQAEEKRINDAKHDRQNQPKLYNEVVTTEKVDQVTLLKAQHIIQGFYDQEKIQTHILNLNKHKINSELNKLQDLNEQYITQVQEDSTHLYNAYVSLMIEMHTELYQKLDETEHLQAEIDEIKRQIRIIDLKLEFDQLIDQEWLSYSQKIQEIAAEKSKQLQLLNK